MYIFYSRKNIIKEMDPIKEVTCRLNRNWLLLVPMLVVCFAGLRKVYTPQNTYLINIDLSKIIFETNQNFVSFALDTSFMRKNFHKLNSSWNRLAYLTSMLAPAYLRLGGTAADEVYFEKVRNHIENSTLGILDNYPLDDIRPIIITGEDWLKLKIFVDKTNVSLLYDINVLLRQEGEWNSENAEKLLSFSEYHNFSMDFQLGNEPNSFHHVFNKSISPEQMARDFKKLRNMLNLHPLYHNSKLIGPDVTRPSKLSSDPRAFLRRFLLRAKDVLSAASWHQYYLNGHTAHLTDFLNPETFDLLPAQAKVMRNIVRESSQLPIWISETGSAYGSGAPGLSDRYLASFLWLDKLGVAASYGVSVVVRQSLYQGHYSLIDMDLQALPDFWISVLYKTLVGHEALGVSLSQPLHGRQLRFYAHCTTKSLSSKGKVTLFGMNLSNLTQIVNVSGDYSNIEEYMVTPYEQNLLSKFILVNGHKMDIAELNKSGKINWRPVKRDKTNLEMPPYSIVFWVLHNTVDNVCT